MHVHRSTSFGTSCRRAVRHVRGPAAAGARVLTRNASPRFRSRAYRILQPAGSFPAATIAAAARLSSPSATACCTMRKNVSPWHRVHRAAICAPHHTRVAMSQTANALSCGDPAARNWPHGLQHNACGGVRASPNAPVQLALARISSNRVPRPIASCSPTAALCASTKMEPQGLGCLSRSTAAVVNAARIT